MTGWLGLLVGRRSVRARLGLVVAGSCLLAAVVLVRPLDTAPWAREAAATSTTVDQTIPELVFPVNLGDGATIDVAATGPARQQLARGIGILWRLGFDFPAGNRSRFGLTVTVHSCQSLPGECDDIRKGVEQARAYPQLDYGSCTVVVDEAATAATAAALEVTVDRWSAAVLAHELVHCDGHDREDVAESRGALWVGRRLGDQRIVREALRSIKFDIDEDGRWRE
ncbi:MAG TPA: hypothetical protein VG276_07710 [Actinomycetes bacterium]|jgi:hypothetical protein|nr:hypothetical protein [Actinomycetes bacterium]